MLPHGAKARGRRRRVPPRTVRMPHSCIGPRHVSRMRDSAGAFGPAGEPREADALPGAGDGKWLYFTVAGDDAVQVLDTATNRVVRRVPVGASPHHAPFHTGRPLVPGAEPGLR